LNTDALAQTCLPAERKIPSFLARIEKYSRTGAKRTGEAKSSKK